MSNVGHAQWKIFASVLIDSKKYFDVNTCSFTDELSVVKLCQNPQLCVYIHKWLSKLNDKRERSQKLAQRYLELGDKNFDKTTGVNDLSADYYTQAIFSAPKHSVELAVAHANRTRCLVSSERFYEEGYFDCYQAGRLEYPMEMMETLFQMQLKFEHLTKNKAYVAETKQEIKSVAVLLKEVGIPFRIDYTADCQWNDDQRYDEETKTPIRNKKLIECSNSSVGRYLVTKEAIAKGEQIYCEEAYSFVHAYSFYETDPIAYTCQHCAKINCLWCPRSHKTYNTTIERTHPIIKLIPITSCAR